MIQMRANRFLQRVFENVSEDIVFVVTHSGMIGALLSAVGRESYSAANAELIPALIELGADHISGSQPKSGNEGHAGIADKEQSI